MRIGARRSTRTSGSSSEKLSTATLGQLDAEQLAQVAAQVGLRQQHAWSRRGAPAARRTAATMSRA